MREGSESTLNQAVLSAWQDELKATGNSTLKQQCLAQAPELLPRFTEQYQALKALPRRLRRALQRHWKRSLAGIALLLALGASPASDALTSVLAMFALPAAKYFGADWMDPMMGIVGAVLVTR